MTAASCENILENICFDSVKVNLPQIKYSPYEAFWRVEENTKSKRTNYLWILSMLMTVSNAWADVTGDERPYTC